MEFKKYPEIENSYRIKYIEILKEHDFGDVAYIASEKIHGANFSFWTDGTEVKVASRTQFVDGTFYKCQEVIDRYEDNVKKLKNDEYPDAESIAVYGELFGPGIQSGVYYGSKKDFMAFEIRIDEHQIEKPIRAKLLLARYRISQVPYVGIYESLDEALKESNEFNSKVCEMLEDDDVCKFEEGENTCEGIVIQPADEALWTGNGARVMIKNKNEKFAEKTKRKKGDRTESAPNPFIPIAEMYVNENRMNAVTSKFGEVTQKDFGKIIGLMNKDVIKDMINDGDLPVNWKKHEVYKPAGKGVAQVVSAFLKENLLEEL